MTPTFVTTETFTVGQLQSDKEIFDFTDSRFIRPPAENGRNFPTFKPQEEQEQEEEEEEEEEIALGNTLDEVKNNEPYLGLGRLTMEHQSFPSNNQVKDRAMHFGLQVGIILL